MSDKPISIAHVGVCVSDLERSMRFYSEALGFQLHHMADGGRPFETHVELDDMFMRGAIYSFDGHIIELIHYDIPGFVGSAERRPMNQLGITHFCFEVDDLEAVTKRIESFGGTILATTRIQASGKGKFIFCTDPDGVRIQLWERDTSYRPAAVTPS